MAWELLASPGIPAPIYTLDYASAKVLLDEAMSTAEKAGLIWTKAPLLLKPSRELLKLVRLSQQQARREGTAEES